MPLSYYHVCNALGLDQTVTDKERQRGEGSERDRKSKKSKIEGKKERRNK
jgi:hypothetical protein